jgi:hypothetical protein
MSLRFLGPSQHTVQDEPSSNVSSACPEPFDFAQDELR